MISTKIVNYYEISKIVIITKFFEKLQKISITYIYVFQQNSDDKGCLQTG